MKRVFLALVVAGIGVLATALALGLRKPYRGFREPVQIEVVKGEPTRSIAAKLEEAGIVRSQYHFLAARALKLNAKLQAGEYRFEKPATASQILDRLERGDVVHYEVTIPEGSNIFDIAAIVGRVPFLKPAKMLAVLEDPTPIRDLDPRAPTLEGYLFPSTYRLARHTTEEQLARMMTAEFRKLWKQIGTGANVHDTVTLASMVEKESAAKEERPMVASVYGNRLKKGIKLDCDPTTIYAAILDGRYRGKIYRSDLESGNPYNTYRHIGMPPGPIANPGAGALEAALAPAESKFLFFVARGDGTGRHNFAADLAAHNRNVAEYRRGIGQGK